MPERITLQSPVSMLAGIGATVGKRLAHLEIRTVEDMLWHVPFRYDDFRTITPISDVRIGQTVTVQGTIDLIANRRSPRKRMMLTEALVSDTTGSIRVVWFNQGFLTKTLHPKDPIMLAGTVQSAYGTLQLVSPSYEKPRGDALHVGRLVPIYSSTAGLTQRQLRFFHATAIRYAGLVQDPLPASLREAERLMTLSEALRTIHFPPDEQERDRALHRLKFDELLLFQLKRQRRDRNRERRQSPSIPFHAQIIKRFVDRLPFTLTNGQRRAAWEILQDMEKPEPMNRLLEGDVGSGKTVVAAIAALSALHAQSQVIMMAPTEILARQHFLSLQKLFGASDVPVFLWTQGFQETAASGTHHVLTKAKIRAALAARTPYLVIGTHALLQEDAVFTHPGLVIIDEQQRFGVGQRELIHKKGRQGMIVPHFLSLTATPIPRTLALSLAGDLKLSVLPELPKGRKPITTHVVPPEGRIALYRHVDEELAHGRQAFVLAPLIEPSDRLGVASATDLYEELVTIFPKRRLGLLHGKLTSKAKDALLAAFANGTIDLLVATAVVEVGIDIPNATVMVVEGAERFGLGQLHQLRGRIGRGEHASYCYLLATRLTPLVRRRLDAVAATVDGFKLAELDLELRGPGDLAGTVQSGFLDFRFASLGDHALIKRTADIAEKLLAKDPLLASFPVLREQVAQIEVAHRE